MKNEEVKKYQMFAIFVERRVAAFRSHSSIVRRLAMLICLILVVAPGLTTSGSAQTSPMKQFNTATGKLKIWVPSGIIGDKYWIYLDGHLKSGPPHGTPVSSLAIVLLADGSGWEAWVPEGRLISSKLYDETLTSYLASGDKHQLLQSFEYSVSPGVHTFEVVVSSKSGTSRSLSPLPFVITRKHEVAVRLNQTVDLYPEVPSDWNNLPDPRDLVAPAPYGMTLCTRPSFDLKKANSDFFSWGKSYQSNQLVKMLHSAKGLRNPGMGVVTLNLANGPREFDGTQIELIAQRISRDYRGGDFTLKEIALCKTRNPQYPKVFAEYEKTISFIYDDIASFYKLAADLKEKR